MSSGGAWGCRALEYRNVSLAESAFSDVSRDIRCDLLFRSWVSDDSHNFPLTMTFVWIRSKLLYDCLQGSYFLPNLHASKTEALLMKMKKWRCNYLGSTLCPALRRAEGILGVMNGAWYASCAFRTTMTTQKPGPEHSTPNSGTRPCWMSHWALPYIIVPFVACNSVRSVRFSRWHSDLAAVNCVTMES